MARLTKLSPEQWDPELREMTRPETASDLEQGLTRFFAHTPKIAKGLFGFGGALKMNRTLPEKLIELVRLRVAFFNQCRSCMAIRYTGPLNDGCTEDLVCSLERPEEAENLTPAEKIAIKYGELMATDHLRIDDAIYEELRKYYTEPQIVELGMNVAFFVGFGRLAATYHMVEELPEAFQTQATVAPWNNEHIVVR